MSDEVMEPLTGVEFDKKKFEKRSSKKSMTEVRDVMENSASLVAPSKTPDKKKKRYFFKPSRMKHEKKVLKAELITNSIQNPSNHPLPEVEEKHTVSLHTNHLSEPSLRCASNSPDVSEDMNDSDSLLKGQSVGQDTHFPRSSQVTIPPASPKIDPDAEQDCVTHDLPLLSPSSQDPPPELDISQPPADANPVLSGNPSPWESLSAPECPIEYNLSQSWEKCRESPTLSTATSNSCGSHTNTSMEVLHQPDSDREFPPLTKSSSSNGSLPRSPQDDSQIVYSYTNTNSQPLLLSAPKERSLSLSNTHNLNDPAIISQNELQSFTAFFATLNPQDGLLYGERARTYFLRSELPNEELSRIWQLSDIDKDKKLTFTEFCIAMKLVRNRKKGIPLPETLPNSLLDSLRVLTGSTDESPCNSETDLLQDSDSPPEPPSQPEDLLRMESTDDLVPIPDETTPQRETDSPVCEQPPSQSEDTPPLPDQLSQHSPLEDREHELDDTMTLDTLQRDPLPQDDEIEDPIPKLSNSSGPINYKDDIKSIFTPIPNPIPPPPSKTEMKQRSVLTPNLLPAQDGPAPSPREAVPEVKMRSHTVGTNTFIKPELVVDYSEGTEDPMLFSITQRGGSDGAMSNDQAKSKYQRVHKRPDRVSRVVLLDQEESHISLINKGEIQTFELSPRASNDQESIESHFFQELNNLGNTGGESLRFRERLTPISSPSKKSDTQNPKSKVNSKKFMFRIGRKKNSGSNVSLEKVATPESALMRKKNKSKKSSKKDKMAHRRSNSYDLNSTVKSRPYGSQNDLNSPTKLENRKIVCALTSDELSRFLPTQKASSTVSLSPTHKCNLSTAQDDDNDSFDSAGSCEEVHSEGENTEVLLRPHPRINYRNNRSLSSPECIMSTTPVPDPVNDSDENRYTITTETDETTPMHQPEVLSNSQERDILTQRILEMASKCESLRNVNSDLINQLNQIKLEKNELKMQLRFRIRNYL